MSSAELQKPLMVFDGQCAFCRRWISRWKFTTGDAVDYAPYQEAASRFPHIPLSAFQSAVHLVEPDGSVTFGAPAALRAFALARRRRYLLWIYEHVPGVAPIADGLYRFVASHRDFVDFIDFKILGTRPDPSTYYLTRQLFLRLLGVIYLVAFASYWVQIRGLIGSNGILPVREFLTRLRLGLGAERYWIAPTLCWLNDSDRFLQFLCAGGVTFSVLLILGLAPVPILAILWTFYLSLTVAGQDFLSFQWDALLLETGLLAILFAPWILFSRPSRISIEPEPRVIPLFLLRWLLFRIMFLSGLVKLTFGDLTWWKLTALDFHYETQPIPAWTSWYMHHAPRWFAQLSMLYMYWAELIAPWLIFGPRRFRAIAFYSIVLLQVLIAATGNYGFFNFLTIVLCVPLMDDAFWRRRKPAFDSTFAPKSRGLAWPRLVSIQIAAWILVVTLMQCVEAAQARRVEWPASLVSLERWIMPLRSVNSYGLFRVMTTTRPEIIIEGTNDGVTWKAYEFKYKAGDLARHPPFVQPHMPRLDWQMWFAALGDYRSNPWFVNLLFRLLQGEKDVTALFETNPFPDEPPRYIRALAYRYRFTTPEERRATGNWWKRELDGLYCPTVSLKSFQ